MLNNWNITCFGDSDGFIDISSTGGINSHDYAWSAENMPLSDSTLQDQSNLVAGRYNLRITDSIACSIDTFFVLREPNPLGVEVYIPHHNFYDIACAGDTTGEIYLTPVGGADSTQNTYLWSTSNGYLSSPASMNQIGISAGTYSLLVTDINNCIFNIDTTLDEPTPILIDSLTSDSAYCFGSATGAIRLAVSGGVEEYNYLWTTVQDSPPMKIWRALLAGIYTVTITDQNACVKIDSIEVHEGDLFTVGLVVTSDYHGADISCANGSDGAIALQQPVGGTAPHRYFWSNGATTPELTGLTAGTYSVIVKDLYECTDSAEVVIAEPEPIDYTLAVAGSALLQRINRPDRITCERRYGIYTG